MGCLAQSKDGEEDQRKGAKNAKKRKAKKLMQGNEGATRAELKRDWEFWAAVIWTGLFIVWMYHISRCLPAYEVDPNQTIRYSELMAVHGRPDSVIYNPLAVFFVFNAGAIGLAVLAKRRWLLLILLANPVVCWMLVYSFFCTGTSALYHLETVEFDDHTYHLARGAHVYSGGSYTGYNELYLYACDLPGELCRGQSIYVDGRPIEVVDTSMKVDSATNTLNVFYGRSVIFTVEAQREPADSMDT